MKDSYSIPRWRQVVRNILSAPFLALILFYRKCIGPYIPKTCRFEPSCSTYAIEAFRKWGPFKGLYLTVWRILRCNPFSHGGVDPVPEEGEPLFRRKNFKRKNFKKIPIKGAIQ